MALTPGAARNGEPHLLPGVAHISRALYSFAIVSAACLPMRGRSPERRCRIRGFKDHGAPARFRLTLSGRARLLLFSPISRHNRRLSGPSGISDESGCQRRAPSSPGAGNGRGTAEEFHAAPAMTALMVNGEVCGAAAGNRSG